MPPKTLLVWAGAVVAVDDELELAAPNGLAAWLVANGDDVVGVDLKLNVGLGAALVAAEVAGALLSVVAGFAAFSPLKRPVPVAGVVVLGANGLLEEAPVVAVPPNKPLDWVVAGFEDESEGF